MANFRAVRAFERRRVVPDCLVANRAVLSTSWLQRWCPVGFAEPLDVVCSSSGNATAGGLFVTPFVAHVTFE